MDLKKKLRGLIEKMVGRVIDEELKERINGENDGFFDVEGYAGELFERYFTGIEIDRFPIDFDCFSESDDSAEAGEIDSPDSSGEFQNFSIGEIAANLKSDSDEVRLKWLRELEISAGDSIDQTSWKMVREILQDLLEENGRRELRILTLKIFQRILFCSNDKPRMVCEAFACLAEIVFNQIETINSAVFHVRKKKWRTEKGIWREKEIENGVADEGGGSDSEVLIKSMYLLIDCQKQMPGKWIRFNGKRLREIVFAFVHLLSSTTNSGCERLSGLELLSILNPTGNWCRHWCHTATGRSLLCSALRKYKNFFVHIVDTVLVNISKKRKSNPCRSSMHDERTKSVLSAPPTTQFRTESEETAKIRGKSIRMEWAIEGIPKRTSSLATFCHSMSLVVVLIQFRSGRSLFPVQTNSRKRLLGIQDLISSMMDYLKDFQGSRGGEEDSEISPGYTRHMLEMEKILRNVQSAICPSRKSADRMQLPNR